MGFVQLIEFTTDNIDEIRSIGKEWEAASTGKRLARRRILAEDRDRPGTYVMVVEFDSYEEAMENSNLPQTQEFSGRMMKAAGSEPKFRNLDSLEVVEL